MGKSRLFKEVPSFMRLFARCLVALWVLAAPLATTAVAQDAAAEAPAGAVVPAPAYAPGAVVPAPVHAIAMHGAPKYPPGFQHFDYVNPQAPKGGALKRAATGSFDSLNPYIIKGQPAAGLGMTYDTLTVQAQDEAFTEYGLIAESMEVPEDRSWIVFNLRPEARFHDGAPITAEDVVYSFNLLRTQGAPMFRYYYAGVRAVVAEGPRRVRFSFVPGDNRELPLILGEMPILPKHYWDGRAFGDTTLAPPVGSGPYRIKDFEVGRHITYERVADWWAKDLPVSRGLYNFDELRYDYYRDNTVALEAFKAGAFDLRVEMSSKTWATGYDDFPARDKGLAVLREFTDAMPSGMQGYAFNLRRPLFQDRRVREALTYAYDFDWMNDNLSTGQLVRTESYFDNSELRARGLPSEAELALLEPWRGQIPDRVFTEEYIPPSTAPPHSLRDNLLKALDLLREAGWAVKDGVLQKDGRPFRFEILLHSPQWEATTLPYARNLKRLGIEATVRTVDSAQYQNRLSGFDFDMTVVIWGQSLSPGNEQLEFYGSQAADSPGSRNYPGLKSPAVDALIAKVISARTREDLVTATRALDRVLRWSILVVPHFYVPETRIALWNRFGIPEVTPMRGVQITAWWQDSPTPRPAPSPPTGRRPR
jgi:microcin C transport system substrate-binding protein